MRNVSLAVLALMLLACRSSTTAESAPSLSPVVAKVGSVSITKADFLRRLEEASPAVKERYATPERRQEFLENMIRDELLLLEAKRRELDKSPAVLAATRRAMIQELLKMPMEQGGNAEPSEAELQQYDEAHMSEFVSPTRVRASRILIEASDPKTRAAAKKQAQRLLAEILAGEKTGNAGAFQAAAIKMSADQQTGPQGGDMRFLTKDELSSFYSSELSRGAMALTNAGELSGVIETPQGFELLKLAARSEGSNKGLEEVRTALYERLARERHSLSYDAFVKKLRADAKVVVNDGELEKSELVLSAH